MEEIAKNMISKKSTADLVEMFEITEKQENSSEVYMVRGWIMDELEARDPDAFDKWIDEGYDKSPRAYFLNK